MGPFKHRKVIITGGLGFVGSHLAAKLVELGADVTLIDSLIPEYGGNLFNVQNIKDQVRINISDVRDPFSMNHLVQEQDFLFNLAGQTSHLDSMENPLNDLEINCRAQLSILEACRKENPKVRIVFASTRQVYGRPKYLPVDEHHPVNPVDVNGINKLSGEMYHQLYCKVHGIPTCVLRLTNTFGPHMRIRDARQTFLGVWIRQLIHREEIEIWGGGQLRDFNYVDDVVDALLLAASSDKTVGGTFNLGSNEVIALGDLSKLLIEINGSGNSKIKPFPQDRKAIDIGDYYSNFEHFHSITGWTPKVGLRQGLMRTLKFFEQFGAHYT